MKKEIDEQNVNARFETQPNKVKFTRKRRKK
jgi:hypothetical protein